MPSLEQLNRESKENGLKILLVDIEEKKEIVASFITGNNYSSTVLLDIDGKVAGAYSVFSIPVAYLIDKQQNVAFKAAGYTDWSSQEMSSKINGLIKE